jgi:hypothetical protein
MCFYCREKVATPQTSDPALVKPGESAPEPKKSAMLGIVGLVSAVALVLGFFILLGWLFAAMKPFEQDPEFVKLTQPQQKEFLAQKIAELIKNPVILYAYIAMVAVAVVGFLSSLLAIIKNAGRKFAIPGLILTALFLIPQILKLLQKNQ